MTPWRWINWAVLGFFAACVGCPAAWADVKLGEPKRATQGEEFFGEWRNDSPQSRIVRRISVAPGGGGALKVHVWGDCGGRDCDWGVERAIVFQGDPQTESEPRTVIHVKFDMDVSVSHLVLIRNPRNDELAVQVFNREPAAHGRDDRSGGDNTYSIERLHREGGRPHRGEHHAFESEPREPRRPYASEPRETEGPRDADDSDYDRRGSSGRRYGEPRRRRDREECVSFDPDRVDLSRADGRWTISDGRRWLFEFGAEREAAEHALDVIHYYHLDRSCSLGRLQTAFSYLLRGDQPPSGRMANEDCDHFDPERLEIRRVDGQFTIVDGRRPLYVFGSREAEAEQALDLIQKYGVSEGCYAGRSRFGFHYLRR
jgi:hypothetical protein